MTMRNLAVGIALGGAVALSACAAPPPPETHPVFLIGQTDGDPAAWSLADKVGSLTLIVNGAVYVPSAACVPARDLMSKDLGRAFGSAVDDRSFGSATDDRTFGAAQDARDFGTAEDARDFGAKDDARDFGAAEDQRQFGAGEDERAYGAAEDQRQFGSETDWRRYGSAETLRDFGAEETEIRCRIASNKANVVFVNLPAGAGYLYDPLGPTMFDYLTAAR